VCPAFPAETRTIHWSVPDPAAAIGSEADRLAAFRATADEIARRVRFLAGELGAAAPTVGS
jgi:protein-tyrosine-phosphatase